MNRSGTGILGLALVVSIFAAQTRHSTGPTQSSQTANHSAESTSGRDLSVDAKMGEIECASRGLRDALTDAYRIAPLSCNAKLAVSGIEEPGILIAIAPDPAHTHLSLFFDRTMEALEKGAQNAGFLYERSWLPWDPQTHPESDNFLLREGEKQWRQIQESEPGILIFRKSGDARWGKLIVLVVGEQPTGGVNPQQFKSAIRYVTELMSGVSNSSADEESALNTLRIIGPTFSGSLISLQDLLTCAAPTDYPCSASQLLLSGTVSSR